MQLYILLLIFCTAFECEGKCAEAVVSRCFSACRIRQRSQVKLCCWWYFFVVFSFFFFFGFVIVSGFACFVLSEAYLEPIYFSNNYRKVLQISYILSLTKSVCWPFLWQSWSCFCHQYVYVVTTYINFFDIVRKVSKKKDAQSKSSLFHPRGYKPWLVYTKACIPSQESLTEFLAKQID